MTKKPWMKWYPSDWRADPRVRMCSAASRGVWREMIDLMHSETDEYGVLVIDGVIPDERRIAKLISLEATEVRSALKELGDNQVYSRRDDGAIFSRRMVRDHARIEQAREHGKLGGNPTLKPRGKTWAA